MSFDLQLISRQICDAIQILKEARDFATDANVEVTDFAVEVFQLRDCSLSDSAIRWLVSKQYISHFHELTLQGDSARAFRQQGTVGFTDKSCFVLTELGCELAVQINARTLGHGQTVDDEDAENEQFVELGVVGKDALIPFWDADRQTLYYSNKIVKQFKLPSHNQVSVLAAFEEEGWPSKIYDPLGRKPDIDPKRRLQDTIKGLNRAQKENLIKFLGDGSGEGILWERTDASSSTTNLFEKARVPAESATRQRLPTHG